MMKSFWKRFKRWLGTFAEWSPHNIARWMIIIGFVIFLSEYFGWSYLYIPVLSDFLLRIWSEMIGIGLAVILIDKANENLRTLEEKERLILQMGSPDHGFAIEAVRQLRHRKWLSDGSLQEANLIGADLIGADLMGADMSRADLMEAYPLKADLRGANLENADLIGADLRGANLKQSNLHGAVLGYSHLQRTHLQEANLEGANLIGADLSEANLEGAINWTHAQLNKAKSLEGAIMPDGKVYNPETFKENQDEQEPPE